MKKALLFTVLFALITTIGFSQTDQFWSANNESRSNITTDKAVARLAYPKEFKLFNLNIEPLRQKLFTIVGDRKQGRSTIISLPNADGGLESFEVFEASNFDPALQARFPEIRAYSGRGITDRSATLKLSIDPSGIQTMVFRTEKPNEFMEPYSRDHRVYSVYRSQRDKGRIQWVCSTPETNMVNGLNAQVALVNGPQSNTGELKTMRLAQSCNAEYSNWFGAFNIGQIALVYAGFNATLTRCNGCYEKDLAIHLNLISNTFEDQIIFFDPATDPYTSMGNWNSQLQNLLNTVVGDANYDIGHMFGASGGGGNAGCIGCVCVAGQKGSGITSPADGIPQGDNFDIDYVAHEVGHQMGGNHTFSHNNEGTGRNKEVGAGITIMGYAGITSYDPSNHSIDIFHETTIEQIQANMATKTCPITTNISANNGTPVVAALTNYTIPKSTPFYLTGSATDPNPGDVLTYCWEQNDNGTGQTGANSVAYPTKPSGPNWLTFPATTSPTRLMPRLSTILAGLFVTPPLPGGDAICNIEALSSIGRNLNFRLTVRDNCPYSSTPPLKIGQTAYQDMTVTVDATTGPFQVTSPNTNVSWAGGSAQTITWSVNGTTGAPINCANVKISLSTDGGTTFPTVLAASTTNDGTESVTIPNGATTTARIKVEAVGNIFFDISDANFTITAPAAGFTLNAPAPAAASCPAPASMQTTLTATFNAGFTNPITLSATGNPGGTTVVFGTNPLTPGTPSSTVTLTGTNTLAPGSYPIAVTGVASGASNQIVNITYTINAGAGPAITGQPVSVGLCVGGNTGFAIISGTATGFQWQVSTNGGGTWNNVTNGGVYSGATTANLSLTGVLVSMNSYQYRCIASVLCGTTTSSVATLTVNAAPALSSQPSNTTVCAGNAANFSVTATGGGLTYQWQESTNGGGTWNNLANGAPYSGVTTSTLTVNPTVIGMNNYQYRCIVTGSCAPAATSNGGVLTVGTALSITSQPSSVTLCAGGNTSFAITTSGTVNSYQWQESTNGGGTWNNITNGGIYSGATTATLSLTGVLGSMNSYQYRCVVNGACPAINSNPAILTVNTAPNITAQPASSTICATSNTSFSLTANGTAISYQWQESTTGCAGTFNNVANGGVYAGATTASLTITGAPATMNGYAYRCVINGTCAPAATSSCVTLTVNTAVTISNQPANSTICAGSNTSFAVTAAGTTPAYQWQESTNGGSTWNNVVNGGVYGGATTATLALTGVTAGMNTYQYRCVITGAAPCGVVNSTGATLTVNTAPAITAQPVAGTTICGGQNTSYSVTANGTALTYQWQVSTDGGANYSNLSNGGFYSGVTTATLSITAATPAMSTYRYRCVISGTCSPAATSTAAVMTVHTPISVTTAPANATICATGTINFGVVAAGTSPTYQWQESTNGGTTWNNVVNGGVYSGATTNTLTLTGVVVGMNGYLYRNVVTGLAPCAPVNSAAATLTVSPRPVVTLSAAPYTRLRPGIPSSGTMVNTTITASVVPNVGPITWSWTRNGTAIPVTGNTVTVDLNTLGTYSAVATLGSCTSAPVSINIADSASDILFIYPSPNNGRFTVAYYAPGASATNATTQNITIWASDGKRAFNKSFTVAQPYQLHPVDMRGSAGGVYYVILREASGRKIGTGEVVIK